MLSIHEKAPDFTLLDKDGNEVSLYALLSSGKKVILYFYPKDNTPGCTAQACGYRDHHADIAGANAVVVGISKDSIKSHGSFAAKHDLPFILLSDPEHKVIEQYDCWKQKKMCGRVYGGTVRTTYLIGEDGTILYANDKVKAAGDAEKMLGMLA